MKNKELYGFIQNAHKLSNLSGFDFVWELQRNKRKAKQTIEDLESLKEELPEYLSFKSEYLKLREEYADRDEKGKPILMSIPNQPGMQTFQITEKADAFAVEEKKIEKKYEKTLKLQEQKFIDYNNALEAECKTDFLCVSKESLPKNITVEQLEIVEFMICDKEEKPKKSKK